MIFLLIIYIPLVLASTPMDPRSVNLAFKTSILFDSPSDRQHLPLLRKLRSTLDLICNALTPRAVRSLDMKDMKDVRDMKDIKDIKEVRDNEILTKFLKQLAQIILNYEDDDIKDIVEILHEEIENFYEKKKTKYDPMIFNPKIRMYVKNKMKEWRSADALELRDMLTAFLKKIKSYKLLKDFNDIFKEDDEVTLNMFVNYFNSYLKSEKSFKLSSLVKDSIKFVIFERYDGLNDKIKRKLQQDINNIFESKANNHENTSGDVDEVVEYFQNALDRKLQKIMETKYSLSEDEEK